MAIQNSATLPQMQCGAMSGLQRTCSKNPSLTGEALNSKMFSLGQLPLSTPARCQGASMWSMTCVCALGAGGGRKSFCCSGGSLGPGYHVPSNGGVLRHGVPRTIFHFKAFSLVFPYKRSIFGYPNFGTPIYGPMIWMIWGIPVSPWLRKPSWKS